jgi:menaquinone-9 beta-reductase
MYDLIVIGGGPAGTSAAIKAARNGFGVLLLERGRFPRHKVCGEFVSSEALSLLKELLEPSSAPVLEESFRITRARLFLDGRVLQASVEPAAASIARFDLDQALWNAARGMGMETMQQVTVEKISRSSNFLVATSAGDFEARAVVNASGRWSNLNASLPPNNYRQSKWIGLKAHFAEFSPSAAVDLYFFEGGYCGVQPLNEASEAVPVRIDVCAMVRADAAHTLPDVFELHPVLRERAARWQPLMEPISAAPLFFRKPRAVCDGVLLAGDAAGFVDPFVGDGISLALRSGALAAQCLEPFFRGAVALELALRRYAQEYQVQLAFVFRSSSRIRRMLRWPRIVRRPIVSLLSNSPAAVSYFVRNTR